MKTLGDYPGISMKIEYFNATKKLKTGFVGAKKPII